MPGNSSNEGGKSNQPKARKPAAAINAAVSDKKAQPGIVGASVVQVGCVKLRLVDSHTLKPIQGAVVLRLSVEHGDDGEATAKVLKQANHALLRIDRPMPPVYTRDDHALFKTLSKTVKGKTSPASAEDREQYEVLLQKQRKWAVYAALLQGLTKLVCAQKGKTFKPQYSGKADGGNWAAFERDILAPIYQKLSGNRYTESTSPADALAEFSLFLARAGILSDVQGYLYIPVPAGKKGSISLEMAHIKVTDPKEALALGPAPVLRAHYDLKRGSYDPDKPGGQEEKSRWRLELSSNPAKSAVLRNFLKLEYDALTIPPDGIIATHTIYGMVWCQPTWFEPSATVAVPEKVVVWDAGTDTPEARARRGMKGTFPTLVVSTAYQRHSRAYGIYSAAGRISSRFVWGQHLAKGEEGSWHVYTKTKDPGDVLFADFSRKAVLDWLRQHEPFALDQKQYKVSARTVKPGTTVTLPDQGTVRVPKGIHSIHECRLTCSRQTYKSVEKALEVAVSNATGLKAGTVPPLWPISRADDGEWLYTPFPGAPPEHNAHLEILLARHPEIVVPKWHKGIDCAGDVGDPVFAACGGRLNHESSKVGGTTAAVSIAQTANGISIIRTLHLKEFVGTAGSTVKAGDVVGLMGRTGNPTTDSPTHAHFQCGIPLTTCPVPGYEAIFPHNEHPKLLPCGADKWGADEEEDNALPTSPKQCRAIPAYSTNQQNTFFKNCWATALNCCPHGKAKAAAVAPPPPAQPKKCSIANLKVVCGHDRPASANKELQVVAETTGKDAVEVKLPCGVSLKGSRTRGGNDTVKVEVDLEDQSVVGNRFVRIDKGEWIPVRKSPLTLDLPENDSKRLLARGAPQRVSITGKGCDDKVLTTLVDVFPGNQLEVGGAYEFDSDEEAEPSPDFLERLKADLKEFYSGGLGIVKFEPELSASLDLKFKCGWAEGDDWRAKYQGSIALEFLVSAEGEVSISLAQIAGVYFGVPPKLMAAVRMLTADVEVVFKLSFEFGVSDLSANFSHYSDRSWEKKGVGELGATGSFSLLARGRVGNKYIAMATVEAGGEQPVSAKGSASLGSEGIVIEGEASVEPLKAVVNLILEGWFGEDTYSGEWEQVRKPEPFWKPKPYTLWKFKD